LRRHTELVGDRLRDLLVAGQAVAVFRVGVFRLALLLIDLYNLRAVFRLVSFLRCDLVAVVIVITPIAETAPTVSPPNATTARAPVNNLLPSIKLPPTYVLL